MMLDKAEEHLRSAEFLWRRGQYRDAVSRAYYASFSAMCALVGEPPRGRWDHPGLRGVFVQQLSVRGVRADRSASCVMSHALWALLWRKPSAIWRCAPRGRVGARATGPWATTEALEARALAHGADVMRPTPRPWPDAQTQARRALHGRRQPLRGLRTAEQNRLAGTSGRLHTASEAPIPGLNARLAMRANTLETRLRASPRWRDNADIWQRAPGIGPGWARTLGRARPALGTRTRQQSAALVGVAPGDPAGSADVLGRPRAHAHGALHGHPRGHA